MKEAASDPPERQSPPPNVRKRGILHTAAAIAACLAIFISAGGLHVILDKRPQTRPLRQAAGHSGGGKVAGQSLHTELYALIKSMEEETNRDLFEDYDNRECSC